jgi:hypothetical protein
MSIPKGSRCAASFLELAGWGSWRNGTAAGAHGGGQRRWWWAEKMVPHLIDHTPRRITLPDWPQWRKVERKTVGVNSETRVNLDFVFFQSDFSASSFLELRSSTLVFMILLESGERRLACPSDPLLKD